MIGFFKWLNPLEVVARQITEAYVTKLRAESDADKLEADTRIAELEARRDVLIAEQRNWPTRWIRPLLAAPVIIFWWKLVVWDTVLGWGTTPDPGEFVMWFCVAVPNVYFLMRPVEKAFGRK